MFFDDKDRLKVKVEGVDDLGITLMNDCINEAGFQIADDIDFDAYIFVMQNCPTLNLDEVIRKIDTATENLVKKGKGAMLLVTNRMLDYDYHSSRRMDSVYQSAIEKYWIKICPTLANKNVRCNMTALGYMEKKDGILEDSKKRELFRRMSVRRELSEKDISYFLKFILSDDSKFVVGQKFLLDGGLENNQVTSSGHGMNLVSEISEDAEKTFDLKGKCAIVFGASSGIGRETAIELAKRGADVSIHARRLDRLNEVKEEIEKYNVKCHLMTTDTSKVDDVTDAIDDAIDKLSKIDIMVYVSGQAVLGDDLDCHVVGDEMFATNYLGFETASEKLCKYWIKNNIKGSIVSVGTIDTLYVPSTGLAGYSVSKSALTQLTKNLSLRCSKFGIRLNCVAPGYIATEIMDFTTLDYRERWKAKIPLGRLGKPDDLSTVICYLVSNASEYITGNVFVVDGGYSLDIIPELYEVEKNVC